MRPHERRHAPYPRRPELAPEERDAQLRLAFVELGRMAREIAELEPRVRDDQDRALLASLKACKLALVKLVAGRMAERIEA